MKKLTVLYDSHCGFCVKCRWWLARQPRYFEMEFFPSGSPEVARRFPGVERPGVPEELTAIGDEGQVYRGARAWIMCLYALVEYREWAERLASPFLMPFARGAFALVSGSRRKISWLLRLPPEEQADQFRRAEPPVCETGPLGDTAP